MDYSSKNVAENTGCHKMTKITYRWYTVPKLHRMWKIFLNPSKYGILTMTLKEFLRAHPKIETWRFSYPGVEGSFFIRCMFPIQWRFKFIFLITYCNNFSLIFSYVVFFLGRARVNSARASYNSERVKNDHTWPWSRVCLKNEFYFVLVAGKSHIFGK